MPTSQAVVRPLTPAALILVVAVAPGGESAVRELLAASGGRRRSVGFRAADGELSMVIGLGSQLWDRMFDGLRPAQLHPFVPLAGAMHVAPSTPGDLLFHIRAARLDLCFELGRLLLADLGEHVGVVVDETVGFRYFEQRDLLGFVDGTENPEGDEAIATALIGNEEAAFAGGSYVVVQKYLHDLAAWNALSVAEQEAAIGRGKLDDVEFADERKPANAHNVLNVIEDADGTQRQIVRENMPFGSLQDQEFGTYFIGYSADLSTTEQMLRNMFLGLPAGNHDRLLDFSTAVTGSVFFCPAQDFLDNPPELRSSPATTQ